MLPTMAGAATRCVIPEHKFSFDVLTEMLMYDRNRNPSKYAVALVSEGAMPEGGEMVWKSDVKDEFGHAKLGGIGDIVSDEVQARTAQFNNGKEVHIINQKLGYLVRGGDPDAMDSIVPMAYGNLALDLLLQGVYGRLVVVKNGCYGNIPLDVVTSTKKVVNVERFYNTERYRPFFNSFDLAPLFIMTSEG